MRFRCLLLYRKKFYVLLFSLFSTYQIVLIVNWHWRNSTDIVAQIHARKLKAVQVLTEKFAYKNWGLDELGTAPFERCAEKRCFAFKTNTLVQTAIETSDGVMVHLYNLFRMPSRRAYRRDRRQLWLLNNMEPPTLSFCSSHYRIEDLDDWFNITTTFKARSTLVTDYKSFRSWTSIYEFGPYYQRFLSMYEKDEHFWPNQFMKNYLNRSSVLWLVSHCDTPSERERYVNELRKHINVDIYGKCSFGRPDPCGHATTATSKDTCTRRLFNSYKFYLAFENSRCDEYITEKYWKIYYSDFLFDIDVLPVVRGGSRLANYEQVAPSNKSFIYAESFRSPQLLADYLKYLDRNATAYEEYFDWKRLLFEKFTDHVRSNSSEKITNRLFPDDTRVFCEMCSKLHNQTFMNSQNEVIKISEFFNPVRDCPGEANRKFYEKFIRFFGFCV